MGKQPIRFNGCTQTPTCKVARRLLRARLHVDPYWQGCTQTPTFKVARRPLRARLHVQGFHLRRLKFEAYFELIYPLQVVDSLITVKVYHCLPLDTIDCPQQPLIQWVVIGDFKFEEYFEVWYPLWLAHSFRDSKVHHCMSLVTIGCPQQPFHLVGDNREFEI